MWRGRRYDAYNVKMFCKYVVKFIFSMYGESLAVRCLGVIKKVKIRNN